MPRTIMLSRTIVTLGAAVALTTLGCDSNVIAPLSPQPPALNLCPITDPSCHPTPTPTPGPNSKFGVVATGLAGEGMAPTEVRRLLGYAKRAGISIIRHTVFWYEAQPTVPAFDPSYLAQLDTFVKAAADSGIIVYLNPYGSPLWARCADPACTGQATTEKWPPHPNHILAWNDFISELMARYDGSSGHPRVTYWGFWNEPNTDFLVTTGYPSWIEAYRPIFEWGVDAARRYGRVVVGPELGWGPSGRGLSPETEFRNFVFGLGYWLQPQDILSTHFYGDAAGLNAAMPQLHSYAVEGQLGDREIWVTEMSDGAADREGSDDIYQAQTVTSMYQAAMATSVPQWTRSFKYDLFWDDNMKLIRDAWTPSPNPRPAYYCMEALAHNTTLPWECQ